ncbi:MAG: stage II sporulation protein P [Bacilli bacterium]|nr:stage II sporulation protein P [Bacilli bacterium]
MKKINLKNNNKKRKFPIKIAKFLFLILILVVSSIFTIKHLISNDLDITEEEYLNYLLNSSYNKNKSNTTFIINESIKLLTNIDLSKPSTLLSSNIKNANKKDEKNYKKDAKASDYDYDSKIYEKMTSYVSSPLTETANPVIYLYNTHQLETYSSSGLENTNITPNVMMTSYLLAEKLNKMGINTIVEDTNIAEFIRISNFESDAFYASTRVFLKDVMNNKTSVKYFIDLHRDSVNKDISTCRIGEKKYARILFVLGSSNSKSLENKNVMQEIDKISDELYPGLSRGIYEKSTPNWPLVYNQDLNKGVLLIEVGGKENTMDEVMNTTEALSKIFRKYIKGD